jgi:hypothetical protein
MCAVIIWREKWSILLAPIEKEIKIQMKHVFIYKNYPKRDILTIMQKRILLTPIIENRSMYNNTLAFLKLPCEIKYHIFKFIVDEEYICDINSKFHYNKNYSNFSLVCKRFIPDICKELFYHKPSFKCSNKCITCIYAKAYKYWINNGWKFSIPSIF